MTDDAARMTHTVSVGGEFRHDIVIGEGLLSTIPRRLAVHGIGLKARVLLVIDANVRAHAEVVERSLAEAGFVVSHVTLRATEPEKTIASVESIWRAALEARLSRGDLMIVVGGGLVGDVGGFAAASFLRGVRFIAVPTTLLAMVDASTGGKTGINLALPTGGLGKNLAGSFWPPLEVVVDPTTLRTLPHRELASGMAECVKHAFLDSEEHVARLEASIERVMHLDIAALTALVAESVAVKARVVTEDPRERGVRATLNFGHTFGHALETLPDIDLTHGEAVAIGMVAACVAGQEVSGLEPAVTARLRRILARIGLPIAIPASAEVTVDEVVRRMGFDKKVEAGSIRFVIPRRIGGIEPKVELPPSVVMTALASVGCRPDRAR
jgi:3-dehydroquinate synthase